jgi:predicted TIM-barrel fold metal-dependent hydrolase
MSEDYEELRSQIMRYLEPALEAFGEERIMIGSDWPIFRTSTFSPSSSLTGVAEREGEAWSFGLELYRDCLVRLGIEGEGMDKVFEGNARRVYKLGI